MRYRDLTILPLGDKKLIFATDSAGAIGRKKADLVKIDNRGLGRFLAQVPFMEILATKALPSYVFLPICNEMEPTASEIIQGVMEIMDEAGLSRDFINGTTEENIPTIQTAASILVMAVVDIDFSFPKAFSGDTIFALGLPKVGQEVLDDRGDIMSLSHLKKLRVFQEVGDILPVGSKGIAYEAKEMARSHGLDLHFLSDDPILSKSAGPGTVVLCSGKAKIKKDLKDLALPLRKIAELL
ncbi:MAG TPA: hypothetical protein VFD08_05865 [Clostridia bacterium]|nr:hypothetical protein [Clostridia bacterium]